MNSSLSSVVNTSVSSQDKSNKIKDFRSIIKRSVLLNQTETALFDTIPDLLFERILDKNFNNNLALAERVLLNKYHEIDKIDRPLLENKKRSIRRLNQASQRILSYIMASPDENKKVLFLTDNDNDGSMAQSVFLEFYQALPRKHKGNVKHAYAQPIGKSRGLNQENVDVLMDFYGWTKEDDVLLVTADIGINNGEEQSKILEKYPKMNLIVTDHHLPVEKHVVQENKRSLIFNPQYKPTEYFKHKNISGADTLAVLLKEVLESWSEFDSQFELDKRILDNITEIGNWSNLLDYVEADIIDMPLRPYTIKKALELRGLLNVSNSMGTLVTLHWTDKDWDDLHNHIPDLDITFLKTKIQEINGLNLYAQKLLAFQSLYGDVSAFNPKNFYESLLDVVSDDTQTYDTPNPNYIAQLRPHIFRISAIDNKFVFFDLLKDQMVNVFTDLRKIEKEIIKHVQSLELLHRIKLDNVTIVFPKHEKLTEIFPRKLLTKIYNEENNGFFLILDKNSKNEYSGSMRSLYSIFDILYDKEDIEKDLHVTLEILGHSKAAGFKIIPESNTHLTQDVLKKLAREINKRIFELQEKEKLQPLPFLNIDFASVQLVQKINTAVKGHLSNMNSLPCILRLGKNGVSTVTVTDPITNKQIDLQQIVATRKYGYQPIQTDFDGNAFVIPVEQIRKLVNEKFNPVLKMSYMDDGVFMANQVVDPKLLKNIIEFKGDRKEQESLIGYYETEYQDGHFIELGRSDFKNLPYFRYNSYGENEFEHWEQLIISLLDKTKSDIFAVLDTEGTGLGQAPKCFNIGGTNIKIAENSGFVLSEDDFNTRLYRDHSGQAYLLPIEKISEVKEMTSTTSESVWKIFKTVDGKIDTEKAYYLDEKTSDIIKLTNYVQKADEVLCNRQLEGFGFAFLIKDKDFTITKEFENLTGISQNMIDRQGMETDLVDKMLTEYYTNLTNSDGHQARIIFSAHNLPYDKGIMSANFINFNHFVDQHILCDSARLSRSAKLAYDDTPVSTFEDVSVIPASSKVYFYDSPYSSYSLSVFLNRIAHGKSGVYPDTTGRYLLRYNHEKDEMSFIDKKEKNEVLLEETVDSLLLKKKVSTLPSNALKFSVQSLSTRAMIRNIILHDYKKPSVVELEPLEKSYESALLTFQEQYHFDATLEDNIAFFIQSQHHTDVITADILFNLGTRFLNKNKDIQAKFHDGWIYQKVLHLYEPAINEGKISKDAIDQVNYYTDLPRKKIEKVFLDTINFKKKFGIQKALVHEQHNNIRHRSSDGQGLSDTSYESVLPMLLAMMKFYNPYTQSSPEAVEHIIETNLKGSMIQLFVKKEHQDIPAIDSFSMKQMLAFDRENKTDLVKKSQEWLKMGGYDGKNTPIRFKLGKDILPPASGIYGIPHQPLTEDEIQSATEKLNFIVINEQIRSASVLSKKITIEHGERLRCIAEKNDKKSEEYKKELLKLFSRIDFQRKEDSIKKLSEYMHDAFHGIIRNIPKSLIKEIQKNPDLLAIAVQLQTTHHMIQTRLTGSSLMSSDTVKTLSTLMENLTSLAKKDLDTTESEENFYGSPVRNVLFLPDLNIRRDDPMKFILEKIGPRFLSHYMLETDMSSSVSSCSSKSRKIK